MSCCNSWLVPEVRSVSRTPKPSLCCPRVSMDTSVGDTFHIKRSRTPSSATCPCSGQGAGMRCSLRSLPTPAILGFYDSTMKTEVKSKKDSLGESQGRQAGALPARGGVQSPLCCTPASCTSTLCLRRASTQKLQLLEETPLSLLPPGPDSPL